VPTWDATVTNAVVESQKPADATLTLLQNYPNPFRSRTTLVFNLTDAAEVNVTVYDIMGRQVGTVVEERLSAGVHERGFDAGALPSGTYLIRLTSGAVSQTRTLLLVR
jgi:hypothetical protein